MVTIYEGVFAVESGTEYRMEFTPQSRWECEISAKYKDGARGVLRLCVRFESTETSLDITVRAPNGTALLPDELDAEGCGRESIPDGVRFCEPGGIPRVRGGLSYVIPQGNYRIEFSHGSCAGAEGLGEMYFSVSINR